MAESKFLIKFSNVNRSKYVYSSPITSKQGYVECKCEYMRDNNKPAAFFFETPRLITATGIYNLDSKFYIDLVVPMSSAFLDWLLAEDETNINATADNSDAWFGERTSTEEISQGYKTSLIFRSKGADPVLRVNIPSSRGKPMLEVFDNNKKLIDITAVVPGSEVACIMEKMPLRFYQDKFTGEYLIYKLKVCANSQEPKLPPGYIFSENSDEEQSESEEEPDYLTSDGEDDIHLNITDESAEEEEDPLAVSGDESEEEEEEDPLAVSGDESEEEEQEAEQSEEEDPLAVSGDESEEEEEEDPLAVSGDESEEEEQEEEQSEEEDPLAVSGDESEEEEQEEDPLAVSGDESEEEEDPLAVSGDESEEEDQEEDPLAVSGDEEEYEPLAISGDELEQEDDPLAISGDEFDISEGGADEELFKKKVNVLAPTELTDSDLELSEFD